MLRGQDEIVVFSAIYSTKKLASLAFLSREWEGGTCRGYCVVVVVVVGVPQEGSHRRKHEKHFLKVSEL